MYVCVCAYVKRQNIELSDRRRSRGKHDILSIFKYECMYDLIIFEHVCKKCMYVCMCVYVRM